MSPRTPNDAYWMIQEAIASNDPVMFFEPKSRYWHEGRGRPRAPAALRCTPAASCAPAPRSRSSATAPWCSVLLQAAELAADGGHERRGRRPALALADRLRADPRLACARPAASSSPGGARHSSASASEIAATVAERAFYSLEAPVLRVSGFDTPFPPAKLENVYLPDADRVLEAVDRALAY